MNKKYKLLIFITLFVSVVYLNNAAWLRAIPEDDVVLLAHRGVHQNYSKEDLHRDECTAIRIDKPEHDYLENTIESISKAFSLGAEIVEIDIHPTTDGKFAVFHDWTIDCRTEGKGVTRKQSLAYLKTLDIGYGYTHDGGVTYPFRSKGVGKIPSLSDVLDTFPNEKFLVNIKSNSLKEAGLIAHFLENRENENVDRLWFYGGQKPTSQLLQLKPGLRGFTKKSIKQCLLRYELIAWTGYVPQVCRDTVVGVPISYTPYLWGWPNLFVSRMKEVNTDVYLVALGNENKNLDGIDDPELIKDISKKYKGIIWTDKIERVCHEGSTLAPCRK